MRGRLRHASVMGLLGLTACSAAPELAPPGPLAHARWAAAGFRDASPRLAARLDGAAAWAVFADVEDPREPCVHEGRLFVGDEGPRAVLLRCRSRPSPPSGASGHLLVVLDDPDDVEHLERAPLDLADAALLSIHDEGGLAEFTASRWLLTTSRGSLLFGPSHHPLPVLELGSN